jgi:propanediol dehydratase small subunit
MSPIRIIIGLLVAGIILAGELAAFWYSNLPETWIPILLGGSVALAGGLAIAFQSRTVMGPYWQRLCTGIRWRRRFPDAPKTEIREFLDLFVDAFAFRRRRRCCFLPDDRVMDVYRALHPPGDEFDSLELETFCKMLEERYGIDFATLWRKDITLGEIYEQTHRVAS